MDSFYWLVAILVIWLKKHSVYRVGYYLWFQALTGGLGMYLPQIRGPLTVVLRLICILSVWIGNIETGGVSKRIMPGWLNSSDLEMWAPVSALLTTHVWFCANRWPLRASVSSFMSWGDAYLNTLCSVSGSCRFMFLWIKKLTFAPQYPQRIDSRTPPTPSQIAKSANAQDLLVNGVVFAYNLLTSSGIL